MRRFDVAFAAALLLDVLGAAGTLVVALRTWQTVTTPRPAPLPSDVLQLSGRTVDAVPTALALVALAGVVAVVATRGVARRVVGAVLVLAGAGIVWRAIVSAGAVGTSRARDLVRDSHRTVDAAAVVPHVDTHGIWAALTAVCGLLVLASGVLAVARGHRWRALAARYERPAADTANPAAAAPALWTALDRGEDPTDDASDDPEGGSGDDPIDDPIDDAIDDPITGDPSDPGPDRDDEGAAGYPRH